MNYLFTKSYFLNEDQEEEDEQSSLQESQQINTSTQTKDRKLKCQVCSSEDFKYKCPACLILSCSLKCTNQHKQQSNCSGQKAHLTKQKILLNDFNLNHLKKDMNFIENAITLSNNVKKNSVEVANDVRVSKKIKNLRYFLKKKRQVIFKQCPKQMIRHKLNTTTIDSNAQNAKYILWTVELIFVSDLQGGQSILVLPQLGTIVLNGHDMINEETSLDSLVSKTFLKQKFHNEQFNLLISNSSEELLNSSKIFIKKLEKILDEKDIEEGELSEVDQPLEQKQNIIEQAESKKVKAVFKEIDRSLKLSEALENSIIYEYPTIYIKLNQ
ncbi:UNKNOWN [Stylonychia lemnae]|uniref:HIT-type domain-containing protein n=1 Tax=Stylonychia lemnae TaxID=5949 RepID=A0A078AP74_STYLE|nr:UNKNOWN [Stylonychia lemnae]|eukprot:CDW82763.1 UNKNOWN [Stylonychia lemnae]